jgi:hypothetical protein
MADQASPNDCDVPILGHIALVLAIAGAAAWMISSFFFQPNVIANPALAAYTPPPATRLIPVARKMDAPELALAEAEPSPLTTLAQEYAANPEPTKPEARPQARKRPRPAPRREDQAYGYGRQWNDFGYDRYWNDYASARQRNGRSRQRTGGSPSWAW